MGALSISAQTGVGLGPRHTGGGTPTPTPTPAPSFSVQPSISGTPQVGVGFVGTPGTASNTTSHTYRWLLSTTSGGTYTAISGATSTSYTPVSGDETKYLKFEDTATGAGGSTVATTTFAGPVAAAAAGISAPVLTKTNAAGAQLAFNVTFDSSYVGKYFHLILSGASNFTTPLSGEGAIREVIQPITSQDVISGPVFLILANQPAGPIFAELFIEDDSPATSAASNVVTETVAASAATFDPATATPTYGIVSNSNKTFAGTDQGQTYQTATSVVSNRALTAATSYIEFTYNLPGVRAGTGARLGLVNSSWNHALFHAVGGDADSWGYTDQGFVYNGGSAVAFPPTYQTNGAVIGLLTQKAAKKAWLNVGGTWYPDTPTFASDGSITSGTGYTVGVSGALYFAVSAGADDGFTVNAAGPYLRTPPTNVITGWS